MLHILYTKNLCRRNSWHLGLCTSKMNMRKFAVINLFYHMLQCLLQYTWCRACNSFATHNCMQSYKWSVWQQCDRSSEKSILLFLCSSIFISFRCEKKLILLNSYFLLAIFVLLFLCGIAVLPYLWFALYCELVRMHKSLLLWACGSAWLFCFAKHATIDFSVVNK